MSRKMSLRMIAFAMLLCVPLLLFAAEKNEFGLGLVLGEPTGLNTQFFWSRNSAVDVTAAWSLGHWLTVAGDFQIYNYLADAPREWRWFYGLGSYMTFPDDKDLTFGIRIPVGIKYHIPYSDLDVWGEIAPGIELLDETKAIVHGGVGLTWWIK